MMKSLWNIVLQYLINSSFHNNEGASIYLSCVYCIIRELMVQNNVAEDGAGIYISDYSTVMFDETQI